MLLPKLKGEKIVLRRLKKADAVSINENVNFPEIGRFTFIPYPNTLKQTYKFINESHAGLRSKRELNFGMEERLGKKIIGCIWKRLIKNIRRSIPKKNSKSPPWSKR